MTELGDIEIWKILAGLGIFLFGIYLLEESIRELAGKAFRKFIRRYTATRFRGIFTGTLATIILQSSSAVTLMLLAFVGAGIMSFTNAIGVVLGSNLGTTFTGWLVALFGFKFSIEEIALPIVGIGGLGLIFLGTTSKYSNYSKLFVGFGFLFLGIDYMKGGTEAIIQQFDISAIETYGWYVFLTISILLTAIVQSSSAVMALVLTALHSGIVSFEMACVMVIGSNVGTTITVILGSLSGGLVKKRVAASHFGFNMVTAIVTLILLPIAVFPFFDAFITLNEGNAIFYLVGFHSLFNLLGILLFVPFLKKYADLIERFLPDSNQPIKETQYISKTSPKIPEAAVHALREEVERLIALVRYHNLKVLHLQKEANEIVAQYSSFKNLSAQEAYLKMKNIQAASFAFAGDVQKEKLNDEEADLLNQYLKAVTYAISSAKTLKDTAHHYDDMSFSEDDKAHEFWKIIKSQGRDLYAKLHDIISADKKQLAPLHSLMQDIKKWDREFLLKITQESGLSGKNTDFMTDLLTSNRSMILSSRHLVIATSDLVLSIDDERDFESLQGIEEG